MTANKGHLGHMVTAAGVLESIMAIQSLHKEVLPHIRNLETPVDADLKFVRQNIDHKSEVIVKNSLVFGGVNCSLVFRKYNELAKL